MHLSFRILTFRPAPSTYLQTRLILPQMQLGVHMRQVEQTLEQLLAAMQLLVLLVLKLVLPLVHLLMQAPTVILPMLLVLLPVLLVLSLLLLLIPIVLVPTPILSRTLEPETRPKLLLCNSVWWNSKASWQRPGIRNELCLRLTNWLVTPGANSTTNTFWKGTSVRITFGVHNFVAELALSYACPYCLLRLTGYAVTSIDWVALRNADALLIPLLHYYWDVLTLSVSLFVM